MNFTPPTSMEELVARLEQMRKEFEEPSRPANRELLPIEDMEACIEDGGKMRALPPLPAEEMLREMPEANLHMLYHVTVVACIAFAHLRQHEEWDTATRNILVLERHMRLRTKDPQGELH